MKYRYMDGFEFEAENAREAAEKLWASKFVPEATLEDWMAGMARRCQMWDGSIIRTGSPEELVEDLIARGFMAQVAD